MNTYLSLFTLVFLSFASFSDAAIDAIIFDFGGVVNVERSSSLEALSKRLNLPPEEVFEAYIPLHFQYETGKMTTTEVWSAFAKHFNLSLPATWEQELDAWYLGTHPINTQTVSIIERLQVAGYKTPLLSDTNPSHAKLNRQNGHYDLFDPIILSYESGVMKTDPQAFLTALDLLGLSPEQCLFIDNDERNIEIAEQVGICSILFTCADALEEALKTHNINF